MPLTGQQGDLFAVCALCDGQEGYMLPDYEGSIRLLAAVFRLWIKEARDDPQELATVARILGVTPAGLLSRLEPSMTPARAGELACPVCGRPVEWSGRGRYRVYCRPACASRARRMRNRP